MKKSIVCILAACIITALFLPVSSFACPQLSITTQSLPSATVNQPYNNYWIETSGGSPPVTFQKSGNFPPGMSF